MCGGQGTRLDTAVEKPLVEVGGRPMVDRVLDALDGSRVGTAHAVVSPHAPATRDHLADRSRIDTPGEGYVADLGHALDAVDRPVLTVAADLPLLSSAALDGILDAYDAQATTDDIPSTTVCVPVALKERLGASVDTTVDHGDRRVAPSGVNVVAADDSDTIHMTYDARLAVNVNRPSDRRLAEALL